MDKTKSIPKFNLKKKRKTVASAGGNEKNIIRGRRAALTGAFGHAAHSKVDKSQLKQYLAAIEAGNSARLGELLQGGLDLQDIDEESESLRFSCRRGNVETVAVLLRHGANINHFGDDEAAAVHIATRMGNGGLLALLLSQGASVNLPTKFEQKTALHIAALHGKDHMARLLLENSADVEQRDIYGTTALHIASRMAQMSAMDILLDFKADVNAYDNDGWTAMHLAADSGNLLVAKKLQEHHAQIDSQNKYGRTPLHWACSRGHVSMVRFLLEQKASVELKDLHGKCSLDYAADRDIKSLLQLNAKVGVGLNAVKKAIVHSIGSYITIDPRESMLRKMEQDILSVKKKELGPNIVSTNCVPTIMEADDREIERESETNPVKQADSDEAFVDHDSMEETDSMCFSIESGSFDGESMKRIRKASNNDYQPQISRSVPTISVPPPVSTKASFSTTRSVCSDTQSSNSGLLGDGRPKDMLKKLTKSLAEHNERLTKEIRLMYNDISKSIQSSDQDRYLESLKSAKTRIELMENSVIDFQDDTEILVQKIKDNVKGIIGDSKGKPCAVESLNPKFYTAMFHAIEVHISKDSESLKNVIKGIGKRSAEQEYELVKKLNSLGNSDIERISTCMAYILKRDNPSGLPFMKDLLDFFVVTCAFGVEARTLVLEHFINTITSEKPSDINTGQMFQLSESLQETGKLLAMALGLSGPDVELKDWQSAPHASNMEMLSMWRERTLSLSTLSRVSQLTAAIIDIEREDLLTVVFQC